MKDKLLLIYPFEKRDSLITLGYCRYILRRQGYSSKIVEPIKDWSFFYTNFQSMGIDYGQVDIGLISSLMSIDYLILKVAKFEPNLVLILDFPIAKRALEFFVENNITTFFWLIGNLIENKNVESILPLYEIIFVREPLLEKLKHLNLKNLKGLKEVSLMDQFKEILFLVKKGG